MYRAGQTRGCGVAADIIAALMKHRRGLTLRGLHGYCNGPCLSTVRTYVKHFKAAGVIGTVQPAHAFRPERIALCVRPFELPKEIETWDE